MIDVDCGTIGGMWIGRGKRSTRRKHAPVPLCTIQIPHDVTQARTRAAAVGSRRLTAWATARSQTFVTSSDKRSQLLQGFSSCRDVVSCLSWVCIDARYSWRKAIYHIEWFRTSHTLGRTCKFCKPVQSETVSAQVSLHSTWIWESPLHIGQVENVYLDFLE
jgi:hypothetical protein